MAYTHYEFCISLHSILCSSFLSLFTGFLCCLFKGITTLESKSSNAIECYGAVLSRGAVYYAVKIRWFKL